MNPFYFLMFSRRDIGRYASLLQTHKLNVRNDDETLNFFHDVLSYKMCQQISDGIPYKLRPHRSVAAHERLCSATASIMSETTSVFLLFASIITPMVNFSIFSDRGYLANYPGCSLKLEEMSRRGELSSLFSITPTSHRLIAMPMDILENHIYWTVCGLSSFYVIAVCKIVNCDILEYWKWLHDKTKQLLNEKLPGSLLKCVSLHKEKLRDKMDWIDEEERELKQLFLIYMDFFYQIKRFDRFISDILSVILAMWATFFAFSIYFLETSKEGFSLACKLWLLLVWTMTATVFNSALMLQRNCSKTYPLLCSLLANYDNPLDKRRFSIILDYFNDKKTTYTLFGVYPFRTTTFLSIFTWSVSCFCIITTMLGRD